VRNDQQQWIEKLKELREQILSGNLERDYQINSHWLQALRFDQHLFYPILCMKEKDANGRKVMADQNTNEPLVKISPVALNEGETGFVNHIRDYYETHKDGCLRGKEIYLLRNESRKGIGFFEASGFYPDFILWVNEGQKQRVVFVDPKGILNLHTLEHPKIQLFKTLKEEVEPTLNDPDISLDSYIISNTPYNNELFRWAERPKFLENHVLFDKDEEYVKTLFGY
jgi:hypothetical protein